MSQEGGLDLEVCVDTFDDALRACEFGATRLEWNQALDLDGLTPSVSSCRWLVRNLDIPVVVMIRPHDRGFVYTSHELACMLEDCRAIIDTGVAGIVFGSLDSESAIDWCDLEKISEICTDVELIFHRAFDCLSCSGQLESLSKLSQLGVDRILTSGGARTASEGVEQLKALCDWKFRSNQGPAAELSSVDDGSIGRCEVLAGGGVNADSMQELFLHAGCKQFHGSFRFGKESLQVAELQRAVEVLKQLKAGSLD